MEVDDLVGEGVVLDYTCLMAVVLVVAGFDLVVAGFDLVVVLVVAEKFELMKVAVAVVEKFDCVLLDEAVEAVVTCLVVEVTLPFLEEVGFLMPVWVLLAVDHFEMEDL